MHSEEQHPTSKHRTFKQTGTTTIFSFGYQSCTRKRSGPSFRKKPFSGCNSGINLVAVLEYAFLQLYANAGLRLLSLRFRKFRRSNVHRSAVVQTNHCQRCTAFFAWFALSKVSTFLFFAAVCPQR